MVLVGLWTGKQGVQDRMHFSKTLLEVRRSLYEIHSMVISVSLADLVLQAPPNMPPFASLGQVLCCATPPAFPSLGQVAAQKLMFVGRCYQHWLQGIVHKAMTSLRPCWMLHPKVNREACLEKARQASFWKRHAERQ